MQHAGTTRYSRAARSLTNQDVDGEPGVRIAVSCGLNRSEQACRLAEAVA